ncbi:MAG: TolC family protein, partial [Deltaproteobacteria bacterium]|nr:TolC family protein [Deltaproteobacteria bacterium]
AVQEANAFPDLSVGAGVIGNDAFRENGLVLSISVPLPVIDRNQGAIDEARALERMACHRADGARAEWLGDMAAAKTELLASWSRYRHLQDKVLPTVVAGYDVMKSGLLSGRMRASELLEARRRLVRIREDLIDAAERFNVAAARIDYLTGRVLQAMAEVPR